MADLNTALHLDMLRQSKRRRKPVLRLLKAIKKKLSYGGIYGLEWGDPDSVAPLAFIRDRYLFPYIKADQCAVEIGPGGGRWTQYRLRFRKLYVVDYYSELLDEVRASFLWRIFGVKANLRDFKFQITDFKLKSELTPAFKPQLASLHLHL